MSDIGEGAALERLANIMRKLRATNRTEAVVLSQYVSHAANGGAPPQKTL